MVWFEVCVEGSGECVERRVRVWVGAGMDSPMITHMPVMVCRAAQEGRQTAVETGDRVWRIHHKSCQDHLG